MKHLKLFLALLALVGVNLTANAQTDVTTKYITNPSFETDEAASDLRSAQNNLTGWTLSSSSGTSNTQWGTANASTTIQGYATSFAPSEGSNYFYLRCNWQSGTTLSLAQTTSELSTGVYLISFDAVTYSSNGTQPTYTFKVNDGTNNLVSGTMTANKTSWSNYSYSFTLTSASAVTLTAAMKPGAAAGGKHDWMLIDNVKLQYFENEEALNNYYNDNLREQNGLTDASATNGLLTSFVVNGTFDSNVNGWQHVAEVWSNSIASNQQGDFTGNFYENWDGTAKVNKMYQDINNIPNGTYKLKIAAFVNNLADPNESQFVFANNDKTYLTTGSPTFYDVWTVVENNTVEIGLEQTTATANWMGIDNVSLTYYGAGDVIAQAQNAGHKADWDAALAAAQAAVDNTDYANVTGEELAKLNTEIEKSEPTTAEGYDEATEALIAATNAFTAAKSNYDALVAEIDKAKALGMDQSVVNGYAATEETTAATALASTQNLKVAEYGYVTNIYQYGVELGTWTTTGPTGSLSDQHYKGSGNSYLEQSSAAWGQNSWEIKYEQNLTLPAGNYVFKVAGRQANSDGVTLSLVVKNGDNTIGTVSDFPKGDTGLGINISGATDFTTGEGHEYVNGGAGRGWEWRYVPFKLSEDATVNVAVNAKATAEHMWVSFCDATVQTDNEANISLIAYNIALESAKTTIADEAYENVTGSEKAALQAAIAADETLDKTSKETIEAAITALINATTAFTGAKSNYDAFVAAKAVDYPTLVYAATSKRTALDNAQSAAAATSASDADTKTTAIQVAARQYYESHALAEGVTGAVNVTELIINADFTGVSISGTSAGAWTFDQTGGNVNINTNEPFTDGSGSSEHSYFDYYNGSNNNQNIHQVISDLTPGRYMLTATGRGHSNFNNNLQLYVVGKGSVVIPAIGNTGGVFDRGWNDANLEFVQPTKGDITIGAKTNNSKAQWWGVTRFRLVKIAELDPASITIKAGRQYTAFSSDRALDFTNSELKAQIVISATGTTQDVTKVPANTGIIVGLAEPATEATTITVPVCADETDDVTGNLLVAVVSGTEIMQATQDYIHYVFGKKNGKEAFYKIPADGINVPANNAYLAVPTTSGAKEVIFLGGETTGISNVDADAEDSELYNLSGVKVKKAQKGVYIQNGKKVIVK